MSAARRHAIAEEARTHQALTTHQLMDMIAENPGFQVSVAPATGCPRNADKERRRRLRAAAKRQKQQGTAQSPVPQVAAPIKLVSSYQGPTVQRHRKALAYPYAPPVVEEVLGVGHPDVQAAEALYHALPKPDLLPPYGPIADHRRAKAERLIGLWYTRSKLDRLFAHTESLEDLAQLDAAFRQRCTHALAVSNPLTALAVHLLHCLTPPRLKRSDA